MNALSQVPKQSSITITPVNNGYVVQLPKPFKPVAEMMPDFGEVMQEVVQGIQNVQGADVFMSILGDKKKNKKPEQKKYDFAPDQHTFIFVSFEKVLAFLAKTYIKD